MQKDSEKSLRENMIDWCKHYQSPARHDSCALGVNYHDLGDGDRPGMLNRLPCLRRHLKEDVVATCELLEWPTEEEVDAEITEVQRAILDVIFARDAITEHLKETNRPLRNVTGNIDCPICKTGTLRFAIAPNGHCTASCTTSSCVDWIE